MSKQGNGYQNLILLTQISIQMMVPIFMCLFAGLFLDQRLGTWFTIPLLFLGMAAGGRNAYLLAMSAAKKDSKKKDYRDITYAGKTAVDKKSAEQGKKEKADEEH